jgi:Xaa-Pro aminopeptidase
MNPHSSIYLRRRIQLQQLMQQGIAVIPTAPEVARNADTHYSYRHDSSFYYLTGFTEPDAVLVLVAGEAPRSILFCREKNPEREIWDGYRYGPEAAREAFGLDETCSIATLDDRLPELMGNQATLHYPLGCDADWDERIIRMRKAVQSKVRSGVRAPDEIRDVRKLLDEMRLFKDEHELSIMRRAAAISTAAHRRAMQYAAPGRLEYQVEAELLHEFCSNGARHPAYTSIVASGANACVLHYVDNSAMLNNGELLLIDAGCELEGYASDITRTFPVNGVFTPAQRDVYQIVLAAQSAAIHAARAGNPWDAPHVAALGVLAQGLIDLKLCHGSVDEVLETESYKQFYMHRTGHWLGMDVHDVGDYKTGNAWRELQPGMVLTVEPGCYIRPADNVPESLANIGIRIEDDVVITAAGNEILTEAAPKTVSDIEELMRKS